MRRALLIATGTVGGLGAVLAVTPPQFTSTENSSLAMAGIGAPASSATTQSATPDASAVAATPSAKTSTNSPAKATGTTQTPAAITPAATPVQATKSISGTFTGDSVDVKYGFVQVKITVVNGKITEAQAVQVPSGKNDRWTQMSVPVLRQKTLAAQSANITGVSGASYTSYGWYTSLASALAKAGL